MAGKLSRLLKGVAKCACKQPETTNHKLSQCGSAAFAKSAGENV